MAPAGTFDTVSSIDGVARLFGYRALANHPLVVMVGLSRDRVLDNWLAGAAVAAAGTILAFAITVLLMWLAMRYASGKTAAQARVAEAARLSALGRLTSGVAHDFSNLLQMMDATLWLLRKRLPNDEFASEVIEQSLASLERGRSLVTQLLGVARPKEFQPQDLDITHFSTGWRLCCGMQPRLRSKSNWSLMPAYGVATQIPPVWRPPS